MSTSLFVRYQERARYIDGIMKMNVKSCFEDFAQSVMHPLQTGQFPLLRQSPAKSDAVPSIHKLPRVASTVETRWIMANDGLSHRSSKSNLDVLEDSPLNRPRSNTGPHPNIEGQSPPQRQQGNAIVGRGTPHACVCML